MPGSLRSSPSGNAGFGMPGGGEPSMGGSPSSLAGSAGQDLMADPSGADGMDPESMADAGKQNVVMELRSMDQRLSELARQFPESAPAARQASGGMRAMLRQIVANPGAPEPVGPDQVG